MEAKYPEITIGEAVCTRLRNIYHPESPWIECRDDIACRYTKLVGIITGFYADRTPLDAIKELLLYSDMDITEIFEHGQQQKAV